MIVMSFRIKDDAFELDETEVFSPRLNEFFFEPVNRLDIEGKMILMPCKVLLIMNQSYKEGETGLGWVNLLVAW